MKLILLAGRAFGWVAVGLLAGLCGCAGGGGTRGVWGSEAGAGPVGGRIFARSAAPMMDEGSGSFPAPERAERKAEGAGPEVTALRAIPVGPGEGSAAPVAGGGPESGLMQGEAWVFVEKFDVLDSDVTLRRPEGRLDLLVTRRGDDVLLTGMWGEEMRTVLARVRKGRNFGFSVKYPEGGGVMEMTAAFQLESEGRMVGRSRWLWLRRGEGGGGTSKWVARPLPPPELAPPGMEMARGGGVSPVRDEDFIFVPDAETLDLELPTEPGEELRPLPGEAGPTGLPEEVAPTATPTPEGGAPKPAVP